MAVKLFFYLPYLVIQIIIFDELIIERDSQLDKKS